MKSQVIGAIPLPKPSGGGGGGSVIKGSIAVNTDFPNLADVQTGWTYFVIADVTDDAGAPYTNTGQSFTNGDRIIWNGTNWSIDTTNVTYTNTSPTPEDVGGIEAGSMFDHKTMQEMWDLLLYPYQYPAFTSFTFGQASPVEVGLTLSGVKNFTWGTSNSSNINANSITIRDVTNGVNLATGLANDGSEDLNIGSIQKTSAVSHTWRISGVNSHSETFTRDLTISWRWPLFYGESVDEGPLDEAAIEALRVKAIVSSFAGSYVFLGGGYKYIVIPAALGTPTSFTDHDTGFMVAMEAAYTINVTNSYGFSEDYNVYRTSYELGSAVTIDVA